MAGINSSVSRRNFVACAAASAAGLAAIDQIAPAPALADDQAIAWDEICDVLVIGFGGAGAVAAISAADEGAKVLLVDKAPQYLEGGNTRYCEQVILMFNDYESGKAFMTGMADGRSDLTDEVIDFMVNGTLGVTEWVEAHGGTIMRSDRSFETYDDISASYGEPGTFERVRSNYVSQMSDGTWANFEYAKWPHTHETNDYRVSYNCFVPPVSHHKGYWEFLRRTVESYGDSISCWFNSPAVKLIRDVESGVVLGATIDHNGTPTNVFARNGVVLSCGSYEADQAKMETYADRTNALYIGSAYNTGDAIDMAGEIGAKMWHMAALAGPFLIPTKYSNPKQGLWCDNGVLRATMNGNSIFVTQDGKRFRAECGHHHHGFFQVGDTYQNLQLPWQYYGIMDATGYAQAKFGAASPFCRAVDEQIFQADTIEELGVIMGIDPATLVQTVSDYNSYCATGVDLEFARWPETLAPIETAPFYGIEFGACFVNAQGGPKRNTRCEVLDYDENPIPHLYSAGELGSFWGGLYTAGGDICETMYSGIAAGRNAAAPKDGVVEPEGAAEPVNEIIVFDADTIATQYETAENEFIGSAVGLHGPIVVKVVVENGVPVAIDVLSQMESPDICGDLFTEMPDRMVKAGSVEVDLHAGATVASRGLIDAVNDALARAAR